MVGKYDGKYLTFSGKFSRFVFDLSVDSRTVYQTDSIYVFRAAVLIGSAISIAATNRLRFRSGSETANLVGYDAIIDNIVISYRFR